MKNRLWKVTVYFNDGSAPQTIKLVAKDDLAARASAVSRAVQEENSVRDRIYKADAEANDLAKDKRVYKHITAKQVDYCTVTLADEW